MHIHCVKYYKILSDTLHDATEPGLEITSYRDAISRLGNAKRMVFSPRRRDMRKTKFWDICSSRESTFVLGRTLRN